MQKRCKCKKKHKCFEGSVVCDSLFQSYVKVYSALMKNTQKKFGHDRNPAISLNKKDKQGDRDQHEKSDIPEQIHIHMHN
jgi:hypothetical protein